MYRSEENPTGQAPEWFEAIRAGVLGNRSQFYRFVAENPFYGYKLNGTKPSEAVIANWWRQSMAGGALAHYATVDSWLEDYSEDLKKITVPVLVMHGEADEVVPFASSVPRAVNLLKNGSLKTYPGYPHGMLTTHADVLNPDLLSFIRHNNGPRPEGAYVELQPLTTPPPSRHRAPACDGSSGGRRPGV